MELDEQPKVNIFGGGIGRRIVDGLMSLCGGVRFPKSAGSTPAGARCNNNDMQGANPCPWTPDMPRVYRLRPIMGRSYKYLI